MYQKERKKSNIVKWTAAAAVFIGAFIILPNTSYTIAHAMEQIPILGQLVEVVTFRNYEYETDRNMADITVPEIKLDEAAQDSDVQEKLEQTADEINAEIQEITDRLVEEFEANIDEEGYQAASGIRFLILEVYLLFYYIVFLFQKNYESYSLPHLSVLTIRKNHL